MRAAIYARVSSQAQREAHTIASQLRVLPAFVASQGWTLAGTYADDGRSAKAGKLDARTGFAQLVRDADAKLFDVVVVVDIDRLTRTDDLEERARILGPFQRNGIQIVTPTGGALDLRTMLGELYVTMQALVAAEENRKRAARTVAGKVTAIQRGWKPAGPTPFGLAYSRETHTWSVHPENGQIVVEIFERIAGGESCRAIADDLDRRGVHRLRGGRWIRDRVLAIARSETYLGRWTADVARKLVIRVPRLVGDDLYESTQEALRRHGRRGLRRVRHVYLLEGLAVCGACGAPVGIKSAYPRKPGWRASPARYICRDSRTARPGVTRCTSPSVAVPDVDARVWASVEREVTDPDLLAHVLELEERRAGERHDWEADAAAERGRLDRLTRVEAGVLRRYRDGAISEEALDAELAEIRRQREMAQRQLESAERAQAGLRASADRLASIRTGIDTLRERVSSASPEERQELVRALVARGAAVFDGVKVRITMFVDVGTSTVEAQACSSGSRTEHLTSVKIRLVA